MSGPKISEAEIEARMQARLNAERDRNANIIKNALCGIGKRFSGALLACGELSMFQDEFTGKVQKLEARTRADVEGLARLKLPADYNKAQKFNAEVEARAKELCRSSYGELAALEAEIEDLRKREAVRVALRNFAPAASENLADVAFGDSAEEVDLGSLRQLVESAFSENARKGNDAPATEEEGESESVLLQSASQCLSEIQSLIRAEGTGAEERRKLTIAAGSLRKAVVAYSAGEGDLQAVRDSVRFAQSVFLRARRHCSLMEELYTDCQILKSRIEELTGETVPLEPLHRIQDANDLDRKRRDLELQCGKLLDDAYIVHALDEAMKALGYDVKKPVRLSRATTARHFLFTSDASDVGIHASVSPEGAVMLEVGGVDGGVAAIEGDTVIERVRAGDSPACDRLVEEQIRFCALHPEIGRELERFGVRFSKRSDDPPSRENAVIFQAAGAQNATPAVVEWGSRRRTTSKASAPAQKEMR